MTELLHIAIEQAKLLSDAEQDRLARMIMAYAEEDDDGEVPPEHQEAVRKGIAELDGGLRHSAAQVHEALKRFGV